MPLVRKVSPMPVPDNASPAAIAATVRKGAALQLAENNLTRLRARRREAQAAMTAVLAGRDAPGMTDAGMVPAAAAAQRDVEELEAEIRTARLELLAVRQPYVATLRDALAPLSRDAGERILSALAELREAAAGLNEMAELIRRAGGEARHVSPLDLGRLEQAARSAVGRGRQ